MTDFSFDSKLLNKLFGWQVAKKARHLADSATIGEYVHEGANLKASIVVSGKKYVCSLQMLSPTLVEGRCSCPVFRRDAELCEHIALLYSHAAGNTLSGHQERAEELPTSRNDDKGAAYVIHFPVDWLKLWDKPMLPFKCELSPGKEPEPADRALARWLQEQGADPSQPPAVLALARGEQRDSFFRALAGHGGVYAGELTLSIEDAPPLFPLFIIPQGSRWRLEAGIPGELVSAGSYYWDGEGRRLFPKPDFTPPASWEAGGWKKFLSGEPLLLEPVRVMEELDYLQDLFEIPDKETYSFLTLDLPSPVVRMEWDGTLDWVSVAVFADYGEGRGDFPLIPEKNRSRKLMKESGEGGYWKRNAAIESGFVEALEEQGFLFTPRGWLLSGREEIEEFLVSVFPVWESRAGFSHTFASGVRKEWRKLERLTPRFVNVSATASQGWLEAEFVFTDSAGAHYPASDILKMIRAGKKKTALPGGRTGRFDLQSSSDWEHLLAESGVRQVAPGKFLVEERSMPALSSLMGEARSFRRDDLPAWEQVWEKVAPQCRMELRPYQKEGVRWMWERLLEGRGALLGDDMGLGKTLQTLALYRALKETFPEMETRPSLLVVPASLLENWREEAEKAFPGQEITLLYGKGREEKAIADLGITTYSLLARDFARHRRAGYAFIAFDEASFVRNPDTDAADALRRVPADFKLALTGTPVENGVRDLWSVFEIVLPGYMGGRKSFRETYEVPIASGTDAASLRRLRHKAGPWILRRTKQEVAPELPPKITSIRWCELSPAHKPLYHTLLREGDAHIRETRKKQGKEAARMLMLTTLLRLRQLCDDSRLLPLRQEEKTSSGKMESFREMMTELLDNGHRTLVFSQFSSMLTLLGRELTDMGVDYLLLDGSVRNRAALVDRFRQEDGPRVFLISLKAGGYGLNLQAADTVIHVDPWWNPAVEAQATDRAYRIGQVKTVNVYKMICRGTVEEKILALQERKKGYQAAALGEDGLGGMSGLDDSELEELLEI